jgi:hypothetical protein
MRQIITEQVESARANLADTFYDLAATQISHHNTADARPKPPAHAEHNGARSVRWQHALAFDAS